MTEVWVIVVLVGVATTLFKAAGPVFLGRRALRPRLQGVVSLLAPVMLTALIVTQTFSAGEEVVVDARVPGVAAAGATLALWRRAPIIAVMAIAAVVTGVVRLI